MHEEDSNLFLYPISYILNKPKWDSHNQELGYWISHIKVQQSKHLGWYCELCGSKSKPKELYLSSLIQRVRWHINGRCPAENNMNFYAPREHIERVEL